MPRLPGPSPISLVRRGLVLFGLILRGARLYGYWFWATHGSRFHRRGEAEWIERQRAFARAFVDAANRLRGGLIKIGQVASLRVDVMPDAVTDELARLQDRVEPHPFHEIAARVEAELGSPIEERFDRFEPVPLAAASLGQVHRARATDGRDLAVKVLYPGIERAVAVDLAMTKLALWLFNFVVIAELMPVYRELRDTLLGEMDYIQEGRAAEEIGGSLAREPDLAAHIRVPEIHWDLTSRRVLSMEFLEGSKINDRAAVAAAGVELDDLVVWVTRAFLHMIFRDGFFHCDPHPGNLMVGSDGRIGLVDFGMHRRIAPVVLASVRKNVLASVLRDSDLYAESLVDGGMIQARDVPAAKAIAELSFDPAYYNLTPRELTQIDFGEYFRRMRSHLKGIRSFCVPDGLVMCSRAISLLYGLMAELAPGIRPLDVLGPYVFEFLAGDAAAKGNGDVSRASKTV